MSRLARTPAAIWSSTTTGTSFAFSARRVASGRAQLGSPSAVATAITANPRQPDEPMKDKSITSLSTARRPEAYTWFRSTTSRSRRPHICESRRRAITSANGSDSRPTTRSRASLLKDFARLLVRDDLALHALERVVDRLRVATQPLRHVFIGRAFEV